MKGIKVGYFCLNPGVVAHCRSEFDLFLVGSFSQPTMQLAMATLALFGKKWVLGCERSFQRQGKRSVDLLRSLALLLPKRWAHGGVGIGKPACTMLQNLFSDERPVYNLPYLVELNEFIRIGQIRQTASTPSLLFSGQLIDRKGVDILIEAIKLLATDGCSFRITVQGDGPYAPQIEQLVRELPDVVKFLGFQPFAQRMNAYADADIFVFPSRYDGWGVVIQEAMAAGMAVVTTDAVGAACDLITHNQSGVILHEPDGTKLAAALKNLIGDEARRTSMGASAKEAVSKLTIENGVTQMQHIAHDHNPETAVQFY